MDFENTLRSLQSKGFWGPFLVLAGVFLLYMFRVYVGGSPSGTTRLADFAPIAPPIFLMVSGVALMFRQLGSAANATVAEPPGASTDADYVVRQLSRNFEILRAQTNQGFLLSGIFMGIGLVLIIASLFAPTLGFTTQGVDSLGVLAGIVTEFISGSALLLYRLNFARLNETSDKLDEAWRVLAAYNLTKELPQEQKANATMQLITSLTRKGSEQ